MLNRFWSCAAIAVALAATGCNSPYHADQGALFGGLTGAGVGALVGNAVGKTGAGAAIGAGVGALSGAAIGNGMDEIEARNRAEIEARLGRPVPAGAVTIPDVVNMVHAGVPEDVVITHVRAHGMATPLVANDLIVLQQQGVPARVVQSMQAPPVVAAAPYPGQPVLMPAPAPVYMGPPPYVYYYRPRPSFAWGVSVGR